MSYPIIDFFQSSGSEKLNNFLFFFQYWNWKKSTTHNYIALNYEKRIRIWLLFSLFSIYSSHITDLRHHFIDEYVIDKDNH